MSRQKQQHILVSDILHQQTNTNTKITIEMGIDNSNQLIFKMKNVVSNELHIILDFIRKNDTTINTTSNQTSSSTYTIDCDLSYIAHKLSYTKTCYHCKYCNGLVRDTAIFLKTLAADTGFIVVGILDGDKRPHSKRASFLRRKKIYSLTSTHLYVGKTLLNLYLRERVKEVI